MPAAKLPGVDKLLGALDHLSHSERIREVVTLARAHRHDPALPVRLGELLARDSHAGALAVEMAQAVGDRSALAAALAHRSLLVRRRATSYLVRAERPGPADSPPPAHGPVPRDISPVPADSSPSAVRPVPEDTSPVPGASRSLAGLVHAAPPALRRALLKGLVRRGQRALGRDLFPEVLARYGPRDAAVLLPVLADSTLRAALPGLAHAVGSWRSLLIRHADVVTDHLAARLDAAPPRDRAGVWQQHAALVAALAELHGATLLDLLGRFVDTCPPHLLWPRLGDLARADAGRLVALLGRPPAREWLLHGGFPRRLLNQVVRLDADQRARLGRLVGDRPELLAPLLLRVAPGGREALLDAVYAGSERDLRIWPDVVLAALPADLQRREAARMLGLAAVQADPDRARAVAAYLDLAAAQPLLQPGLRAADADERGRAVARTIACAAREAWRPGGDAEALSAALALLAPRLKNDQDPVRLAAFTALAAVAPTRYRAQDDAALRGLVTAAIEARDTSFATRQQIQHLAFRLLRAHATRVDDALFRGALELLRMLAAQSATLALPDLSRGLPRRTAPEIVAALRPLLAAAAARERPQIVLALAAALGRRGHGLAALDELLEPLRTAKPDNIATQAIGLLLADRRRRDERVRALLAWDRSVIALPAVADHLHRRRQELLDPFLAGTAISGRFLGGKTIFVPPFASCFHRWLPRQQRAFLAVLGRAAKDRGQALWARAAALARIARLPVTTVDDFAPYLASGEVPVIEAALGALCWTDAPADALPVLLAHLAGDRARVAMYALPRVARFVDGAVLTPILIDLIAGPGHKVTVRKEALRLLGEHRSAATVPALERTLATPDLHKDVAIAVGHAARSLLDDPHALTIVARLAASPAPDVARSVLDPRPEQLPAAARRGYAALVLGLARHPDLATRRAAIAALPAWSSGQEAESAGALAAIVLDLAGGEAWPEACAALVAVGRDGAVTAALVDAAAGLAARADERHPDPQRDLPARQRLVALVAALRGVEPGPRLALGTALAAVADALVADDLWPLAVGLRVAAIDLAATDAAAAALRSLAADARADAFPGELVTCLEGQIAETAARVEPAQLLALAGRLAAASPPAARLAVALVAAAGRRTGWPAAACDALAGLREHADLRVRHAARQVFTRPEAPGQTSDGDD